MRAPVAWATRLAASSPGRRIPAPPSRITHGSPLRSTAAAEPTTSSGTGVGGGTGNGRTGSAPSDQETSAGRMSVATPPGGAIAAATAFAAAVATSAPRAGRPTHAETERATASMSDSSGASNCLWYVA